MKTTLKILGWTAVVIAALVYAFFIAPELSESAKWWVGGFILLIVGLRGVQAFEADIERHRTRTREDLSEIKSDLRSLQKQLTYLIERSR